MSLPAAIVIPTYNRQQLIAQAVRAALGQSHPDTVVIVVDDGSTDATAQVMARFASEPRLSYVRLARNVGTAQAKNIGIMLAGDRVVTFHDSDDLPHRDKLLRQARVMARTDIGAHPCLNWPLAGHRAGQTLPVGLVLSHHQLILPDGRSFPVRRTLSLVDDIFPNLQMGSEVPGDWTHVNSGLFRPQIFATLGGFSDCIEEDRELRNRIILSGEIVWVIPDLLLTKYETEGALTQDSRTDYDSGRRRADRLRVWRQIETWLADRSVAPCPVDLPAGLIASATNPGSLALSHALATPPTRAWIAGFLQAGSGADHG